MKHEDKLPENIGLGLTVGIVIAIVSFTLVAWLLWQIPIPVKLTEFTTHINFWAALKINELSPPLFQATADTYRQYLGKVEIGSWPFIWRLNLASFIGLFIGGYIGYLVGKPESAIRHVSGRQLFRGSKAVRLIEKESEYVCKSQGKGLAMHPTFNWRLSRNRETNHFMLIGSSGSGKTTVIIPLIRAAIARNDRMVIYDIKGNFTRWLPEHILIAPCDERSLAWDIARDCRNSLDAKEIAARFIAEGSDPMWHQAARMVLTSLIIKLQIENGVNWGWLDLYNLVCLDEKGLLSIMEMYLPEAVNLLKSPGKTTQSILINFSANMTDLSDLAKAWGGFPPEKRFSFLEWLKDEKAVNRIVVLQGNGRYESLTKSYIQGLIAMATGLINSPDFPDAKRRIWLFFDEYPTLGKMQQASTLITIARSRGVRIVLTAQDIHQIKEIYGENLTSSWMSSIGTLIILKINAGETANFFANKIIGDRTIDRTIVHNKERQAPLREKVLVMEPSELQSDLGRRGDIVSAVVMGFENPYLLHWPATDLTEEDMLRKASVPAKWLEDPAPKKSQGEQVSNVVMSVDSISEMPARPRLVLRNQVDSELIEMAESGTNMSNAGEPIDAMSASSIGGHNESR
jgi:hypothetical protein